MRRSKIYAFLFFAGLLLFSFSLANTSLWDNDEPTYAEIAKEMLKSGNWLTPTFNNELWFCHPPLYMWLTASIFKAFGWSEFTARLFPALFALLGMLIVFEFASYLWDEKSGVLSALILVSSLQYLVQGGMATMDTMLNAFLLLAIYSGWRALLEQKQGWWMVFFLSSAFATLSKGVFGLVYPFFIIGIYLLYTGQLKRYKEIPWGKGLLLYFFLAAPWFVYETWHYGEKFLYQVFYFYTFKRVVSPILNQSGPWYYYVPVLLFGFFPWSGFLPSLAIKGWEFRKSPEISFLGLWILSTFLFFTLVHTKLPNYIFFLYPPLAMLLGWSWKSLSKAQILTSISLALILLGGIAAALFLFAFQKLLPQELNGYLLRLLPILAIPACTLVLAFFLQLFSNRKFLVFSLFFFTMGLFWFTLHHNFAKTVETYKPMKLLAGRLRAYRAKAPFPVVAYHVPGTASLIFYSDTPIANVNTPQDFLKRWRKEKLYCFMEGKTLDSLHKDMGLYWPLMKQRTIWLLANFNPVFLKESTLTQKSYRALHK